MPHVQKEQMQSCDPARHQSFAVQKKILHGNSHVVGIDPYQNQCQYDCLDFMKVRSAWSFLLGYGPVSAIGGKIGAVLFSEVAARYILPPCRLHIMLL